MAKSLAENARIDFVRKLEALRVTRNLDNEGLAKLLGCSVRTLSNIRSDPFSVKGKYILMTQAYLEQADRRRHDYGA